MPLIALALGLLVSRVPAQSDRVFFLDQPALLSSMALKTVIHSHLVIVLFRSHGNAAVRRRHPLRFTVVPALLFASMFASTTLLAIGLIVSTYWDAVHSSLQTFGIGRIYDMKAGADVHKGRQLDVWLNHAIYLGPFVCGPLWLAVADVLGALKQGGFAYADGFVDVVTTVQPALFWVVVVGGPALAVMYVVHVVRRARAGERLSWQKYALFATTAATSIYAWGFNPFGQALLIVNVFHAAQYFAIVWWSERDNIGRLLGTSSFPQPRLIAAAALVVVGVTYGFWLATASDYWASSPYVKTGVLALTNTIALLHFWYDGFIWSVRKRDVG